MRLFNISSLSFSLLTPFNLGSPCPIKPSIATNNLSVSVLTFSINTPPPPFYFCRSWWFLVSTALCDQGNLLLNSLLLIVRFSPLLVSLNRRIVSLGTIEYGSLWLHQCLVNCTQEVTDSIPLAMALKEMGNNGRLLQFPTIIHHRQKCHCDGAKGWEPLPGYLTVRKVLLKYPSRCVTVNHKLVVFWDSESSTQYLARAYRETASSDDKASLLFSGMSI